MKKIKEDVAAILFAVLLIAGFIIFTINGDKNQINSIAQNRQAAERRLYTEVSRGGETRQVAVTQPKALTFSGPEIPEHNVYIDQSIARIAKEIGIDPYIVAAMVWKESTFNPKAKGGGYGLLQLESACCREIGVRYPCTDIDENLWAGSVYYKEQLDNFGDERIALAAYNYGPPRVERLLEKYGYTYENIEKHLPFITRNHVKVVLEYREIFKELNRQ